jgi:periplasmic divalent cation tolerance protein
MIKTQAKHFKAIEKIITRLHSYDVPELIAVPIIAGSKKYLKWIESIK